MFHRSFWRAVIVRPRLNEHQLTRKLIMSVFNEIKDGLADLSVQIDALKNQPPPNCDAQVDAAKAEAEAKYDHDMGELKVVVDGLRAKLGDFESSNN